MEPRIPRRSLTRMPATVCNKLRKHRTAPRLHTAETEGKSGHGRGLPHVQCYRQFLHTLITIAKEKAQAETEKDKKDKFDLHIPVLEQHRQEFENLGAEGGWWYISQFLARTTRDDKAVVSFQLSTLIPPEVRHKVEVAIVTLLLALGSEVKAGGPPKSQAERKHQAGIDPLKARLGYKK